MPRGVTELDRELQRGAFQQGVLGRRDGDGGDGLAAHGFPGAGRGSASRRATQSVRRVSGNRGRVEAERAVPNLERDGVGSHSASADARTGPRVVPRPIGVRAETDLVGAAGERRTGLGEHIRPRVMAHGVHILFGPVPDTGDVHSDDRGTADREAHMRGLVRPDVDVPGIGPTDRAIGSETAEKRPVASGRETGNSPARVHGDG